MPGNGAQEPERVRTIVDTPRAFRFLAEAGPTAVVSLLKFGLAVFGAAPAPSGGLVGRARRHTAP